MQEELMIRHCSPTLAGLKTANMFMCRYENEKELFRDLNKLNNMFSKKGVRIIPLTYVKTKALIYIYRPEKLRIDLEKNEVRDILKEYGYVCDNPEKCIIHLMERLKKSNEFPHEIGFFLGYPPEDVKGFIDKKECKFSGFWKVYGNPQAAEKKFEQFRKCTKVYYSCWCDGCPLEKLTVSLK